MRLGEGGTALKSVGSSSSDFISLGVKKEKKKIVMPRKAECMRTLKYGQDRVDASNVASQLG